MTYLEKAGLITLIISAVILFSGRELSSFYAAVAVTGLSLGMLGFLIGGKDIGGGI